MSGFMSKTVFMSGFVFNSDSFVSECPNVRLSACPTVRVSECPTVCMSDCPSVTVPACLTARVSPRPRVWLSECPRVWLSVCPCVRVLIDFHELWRNFMIFDEFSWKMTKNGPGGDPEVYHGYPHWSVPCCTTHYPGTSTTHYPGTTTTRVCQCYRYHVSEGSWTVHQAPLGINTTQPDTVH